MSVSPIIIMGCEEEMIECYRYQCLGYDAGIEFVKGHAMFFAFKGDKWVVPFYEI